MQIAGFRRSVFWVVVLALITTMSVARAEVSFGFNIVINGDTPSSTRPWLIATFEDIALGDVRMTLTNNMSAGAFVDSLVFNSILSGPLSFANNTPGTSTASVTKSSNETLDGGANIKAGLFNIAFQFPVSNAGGFRFSGGEVSQWEITGAGLTASNFLKVSLANANTFGGLYYMAAHVQGIPVLGGGTTGGSIGAEPRLPPAIFAAFAATAAIAAIPEPEIYAAMLAGLGLLGFAARRRKQQPT